MSSIPAAIVDEAQEAMFSTAADGDESSESITAFVETLDDDVLFYPDAFLNDTVVVASGGELYAGDTPTGDYTDTHEIGSTQWTVSDSNPGEVNYSVYFDTPGSIQIEGIRIAFYCAESPLVTHDVQDVMVRKDGGVWEDIGDIPLNDWGWVNVSLYGDDYWNTSYVEVGLYLTSAASEAQGMLKYAEVTFYEMHLADSDHYAEGFNDVSDWPYSTGEAHTTDGDVMTKPLVGDNVYKSSSTNSPSFTAAQCAGGLYYEFTIDRNASATAPRVRFIAYSGDDRTGDSYNLIDFYPADGWRTKKGIIQSDYAIECLMLHAKCSTNTELYFDTFRIGPADEFGWQHDCSTTAGVTDGGGGSSSSDGDELTLTADSDGSTFEFAIDTTATAAYLDADYYPMIGLDFNDADSEDYIKVESYDGAAWATVIANTTAGTVTHYANCRAADADIEKFRISVNPSANPRLKWFKAFLIANFTLTQSASCTTSDVIYVDSDNNLVFDRATTAWMVLEIDPAPSITISTYPVWNITKSGSDSFGIRVRGSPSWGWRVAQYGTTRGATADLIASSDTSIIDIQIHNQDVVGVCTISALKFIEDSTAPDADIVVSPDPPDDDEQVTLSSIVFDDVEVWKVWYNAISYPSGFSDVDYEATEGQENFWSYSFSSLIAGDYCFKVIANDGANNNTITQSNRDYATTRFTVRESAIVVEEITLIGAGSDFTMMQFSARINKDCSYVIYEESANNAEAATHSGSVSEPSFNLAWTKLSTTDTNVNFTIKFTNGTLTYNYTSQYQVAQTVLSVTSYDWALSETQVTLSYQTSKSGTYTLYLNDVQDSTSSFVAGSNFLNWSRPSAVDPAEIDAAVKLTDGTTTIWLNQTYSEYSLTAFSIQTLFMGLTDPSISAIFTTSWGNSTGYLYEADVQKATGAEGTTLSYTKSTTAGTYNVALKIDAGGEVAWYNTTYTIATTELRVEEDRIETSDTYAYCRGYLTLNADYKVYEETVEVATGSVNAGHFRRPRVSCLWLISSRSTSNLCCGILVDGPQSGRGVICGVLRAELL
jgi:hypothetical protein